jgi:hypothetical protein
MYLFPFLDFRLKSEHITSLVASSNPISVFIILSIGVLLLAIVSINFINLSTVWQLFNLERKSATDLRC